jgi:hypothetical protein
VPNRQLPSLADAVNGTIAFTHRLNRVMKLKPVVVFVSFLCAVAGSVPATLWADAAKKPQTQLSERWYVVSIEGKKIGHQHSTTSISQDVVRQTEVLDVVIERGGEKAALYTETMTEEALDGRPLAFAMRYRASQQDVLTQGKVLADRRAEIVESVNSTARAPRSLQLAPDALFPYAQVQKLRASGLKPGLKLRFVAFDPTVMLSFPVDTEVLANENFASFDGQKSLLRVKQNMQLPQTEILSSALVDHDFNLYQLDTEAGGVKMRLTLSSRASALADNERSNFFIEQFVKAPSALSAKALNANAKSAVRYQLHLKTPTASLPPQTDEQLVTRTPKGFELVICARCGNAPAGEKSTTSLQTARKATAWLQSDDGALRAAALTHTKNVTGARAKMLALQDFVARHITESNLSTAYASAKEAFEAKTGDCTENALLLAAMGRAVDIPTRVVAGLAYAPNYLGQRDMFIPHAWMQAFIDGRWQSFDAALGGFDAGHIALAVTDGDPSNSFMGATLLGNLVIDSASVIANANANTPKKQSAGEQLQ